MTDKRIFNVGLLNTSGAQRNALEFLGSGSSKELIEPLEKVQASFKFKQNYEKLIAKFKEDEGNRPSDKPRIKINDHNGNGSEDYLNINNFNKILGINLNLDLDTITFFDYVKQLNDQVFNTNESRLLSGIDNDNNFGLSILSKLNILHLVELKNTQDSFDILFIEKESLLSKLATGPPEEELVTTDLYDYVYNVISKLPVDEADWRIQSKKNNVLKYNFVGLVRHVLCYVLYQQFLIEVFLEYIKSKKGYTSDQITERLKSLTNVNFINIQKKNELITVIHNSLKGEAKDEIDLLLLNEVAKSTKKDGLFLNGSSEYISILTESTDTAGNFKKGDYSGIITTKNLEWLGKMLEQKKLPGDVEGVFINNKNVNKPVKEFYVNQIKDVVVICIHNDSNIKLCVFDTFIRNLLKSLEGKKFIIGIDTNVKQLKKQNMDDLKEDYNINYYPPFINENQDGNCEQYATTNKYRTGLQAQWSKISIDNSVKDIIITNGDITGEILVVDSPDNFVNVKPTIGVNYNKGIFKPLAEIDKLIPNDHHLFDHYLVKARIEFSDVAVGEAKAEPEPALAVVDPKAEPEPALADPLADPLEPEATTEPPKADPEPEAVTTDPLDPEVAGFGFEGVSGGSTAGGSRARRLSKKFRKKRIARKINSKLQNRRINKKKASKRIRRR